MITADVMNGGENKTILKTFNLFSDSPSAMIVIQMARPAGDKHQRNKTWISGILSEVDLKMIAFSFPCNDLHVSVLHIKVTTERVYFTGRL